MNDYWLSVLLGIVEGLTEFLPVSSTAHLRLSEFALHIDLSSGYWKMYSIVIQLGAVLVLPIYFRERIAKFIGYTRGTTPLILVPFKVIKCLFLAVFRSRPVQVVLIAFVVTAVPSWLLTKVIGKNLENIYVMAWSLIIGGVVMWIVDAMNAKWEQAGPGAPGSRIRTWHMEEMSFGQAVWVGFCQIFSAVFPGTSRSMSTIAGGQVAGMSRASALEFSFFVAFPTMLVATGYTFLKSVTGKGGENPIGVSEIDPHGWVVLAIGFIVSFVVAYVAVAWFLAWVRKHGFVVFAVYRIILGAWVLVWAARHLR